MFVEIMRFWWRLWDLDFDEDLNWKLKNAYSVFWSNQLIGYFWWAPLLSVTMLSKFLCWMVLLISDMMYLSSVIWRDMERYEEILMSSCYRYLMIPGIWHLVKEKYIFFLSFYILGMVYLSNWIFINVYEEITNYY